MAEKDIALMAHLMRRAGFGASRDELEERAAKGYDATVEELLHPEEQEPVIVPGFQVQGWYRRRTYLLTGSCSSGCNSSSTVAS